VVADELRKLGALPAAECASFEEAAERGGEDAGRGDLAGVHHRGVREEGGAAGDEVLEVGAHLRLEQAAQDLEVLARGLADARALELVDRLVDLLDERDLDGAQGGVAAFGSDAFRCAVTVCGAAAALRGADRLNIVVDHARLPRWPRARSAWVSAARGLRMSGTVPA